MKQFIRNAIILFIAISQPVIWWMIYTHYAEYATKMHSEGGLKMVCIISPILIIIASIFMLAILNDDD